MSRRHTGGVCRPSRFDRQPATQVAHQPLCDVLGEHRLQQGGNQHAWLEVAAAVCAMSKLSTSTQPSDVRVGIAWRKISVFLR